MESGNFKKLVADFTAAHAQLSETTASAREQRKRTQEMQAAILAYMQEHGIDECSLPDARLVRKTTKKTEGLKKEHIEGELKRIMGGSGGAAVEEAVTNMYNRRMTDVQETLAVVKTQSAPATQPTT